MLISNNSLAGFLSLADVVVDEVLLPASVFLSLLQAIKIAETITPIKNFLNIRD